MNNLIKAIAPGTRWSVHTGTMTVAAGLRVRAIKLTDAEDEGSTALTVTNAAGDAQSTGELQVGALEPISGIKAVTAIGAGVLEYRVYYY